MEIIERRIWGRLNKNQNSKLFNLRQHHFSRAFKNINAPKTNLSGSYHSSYVTGHATNLTLLDAAYRDTAAAMSLGRSLELFEEGFKCQETGPTQKETNSRKRKTQKSKVNTSPFKRQIHKMVKHTQTIRRQIADELFECV